MIPTRTKSKFRYDGDPEEVTLRLSSPEAYEIADALESANAPNGVRLKEFLEDSEESNADLIKDRKEA